MRYLFFTLVTAVAVAAAACGSGSSYGSSSSPTKTGSAPTAPSFSSQQTTASPASVASTAASPAASAAASPPPGGPGTNPATRVNGSVKTVAGTKVTLADGTSFDLTPTTRITHQQKATVADLKQGVFVAITAKRQTDNTLLASIVSIFSDSQSKVVPPGQRPLTEGNLMTNAAIDQITGNTFTVTFTGGGARVTIAPDAQILKTTDSTAADIQPGTSISASVTNGSAGSVSID